MSDEKLSDLKNTKDLKWRKNSHYGSVQGVSSLYGDLGWTERYTVEMQLLVCANRTKFQSYQCLPVEFSINTAYIANSVLYKLYTKIACFYLVALRLHDGKLCRACLSHLMCSGAVDPCMNPDTSGHLHVLILWSCFLLTCWQHWTQQFQCLPADCIPWLG